MFHTVTLNSSVLHSLFFFRQYPKIIFYCNCTATVTKLWVKHLVGVVELWTWSKQTNKQTNMTDVDRSLSSSFMHSPVNKHIQFIYIYINKLRFGSWGSNSFKLYKKPHESNWTCLRFFKRPVAFMQLWQSQYLLNISVNIIIIIWIIV